MKKGEGKGKKLYNKYALDKAIAISRRDEDDMELAKRHRSDPFSCSIRWYGEGAAQSLDHGES